MKDAAYPTTLPAQIHALVPRGNGHCFVVYGDSCSGLPGAPHESTFAGINAVVSRFSPRPDFIVFPGDEIAGLTSSESELKEQWRYWLDVEMAWLDRLATPLFQTTSNHTTYSAMSEQVFAEMLPHLPRNGPPGQEGLSYFVRRDDLLLVFVNTVWSGLGGEGHVETEWLNATLQRHRDARYKLVVGHHPVFPVNGFAGAYQREIGPEHAGEFWQILVKHDVFAYLCSHILAFDVQVHDGVLQILTAGAGTAYRMPEDIEYLHCVQAALDAEGLRYQVRDPEGQVRERLSWPLKLPSCTHWQSLLLGEQAAPDQGALAADGDGTALLAWHFTGRAGGDIGGQAQTLISAWSEGNDLASFWIGLSGKTQRLTIIMCPEPGRSPHYWFGPCFAPGVPFECQVLFHFGMGPGGVMWRENDGTPWSSLNAASAWGAERLRGPDRWAIGFGKDGAMDCPFQGQNLKVAILTSRDKQV